MRTAQHFDKNGPWLTYRTPEEILKRALAKATDPHTRSSLNCDDRNIAADKLRNALTYLANPAAYARA